MDSSWSTPLRRRCGRCGGGRSSKAPALPIPEVTAIASACPRCAIGTSSSGSSPTTARSAGGIPRRAAALRSASSDGLPTTCTRQPVRLLIIAEIAREVPSAGPCAVAKNIDCELLYTAAPSQTAWQAASSAGMVNSGYQPTSTASACSISADGAVTGGRPPKTPPGGRTTSRPASSSGPARPSPPRTSTRRCRRRVSAATALLAGVITASSGRSNPMPRNARASSPGVLVVPLVNTTNGTRCRAAQRVISSAPGTGVRPRPLRSPGTSVPSGAKTTPRTVCSRARPDIGLPAPAETLRSATGAALRVASAQFQPEAVLVDDDVGHSGAFREPGEQVEYRLELRVITPPRRPRGEHRVDLVGGHGRPQQELLVADARREAPA